MPKPFAMVSHDLTESLDSYAHKIYTFLRGRAGKSGVCRWTQQAMADRLGISRKTVTRRIRSLVSAGLLIVLRTGHASTYEVNESPTARQLRLFNAPEKPVEMPARAAKQKGLTVPSEGTHSPIAASRILISEKETSKKKEAAALDTSTGESRRREPIPAKYAEKIPEWLRDFTRRAENDLGDCSHDEDLIYQVYRAMQGAPLSDLTELLLRLDGKRKPRTYGFFARVIEEEMNALRKRRTDSRIDAVRETDVRHLQRSRSG